MSKRSQIDADTNADAWTTHTAMDIPTKCPNAQIGSNIIMNNVYEQ